MDGSAVRLQQKETMCTVQTFYWSQFILWIRACMTYQSKTLKVPEYYQTYYLLESLWCLFIYFILQIHSLILWINYQRACWEKTYWGKRIRALNCFITPLIVPYQDQWLLISDLLTLEVVQKMPTVSIVRLSGKVLGYFQIHTVSHIKLHNLRKLFF